MAGLLLRIKVAWNEMSHPELESAGVHLLLQDNHLQDPSILIFIYQVSCRTPFTSRLSQKTLDCLHCLRHLHAQDVFTIL